MAVFNKKNKRTTHKYYDGSIFTGSLMALLTENVMVLKQKILATNYTNDTNGFFFYIRGIRVIRGIRGLFFGKGVNENY